MIACGIPVHQNRIMFKRPPGSSGTLCNGGSALVVDIAGARAVPNSFTRRGRPVSLAPGSEDAHRRLSDRSPGSGTSCTRTRLKQSRARPPGYGNAVTGRPQEDLRKGSSTASGPQYAPCECRMLGWFLSRRKQTWTISTARVSSAWRRTGSRRWPTTIPIPERARLASLALRRLYIEHLRQAAAHENPVGPTHEFQEVRRHRPRRWNHRWRQSSRRPERTRQIDAIRGDQRCDL